jgi:hypothetical protein
MVFSTVNTLCEKSFRAAPERTSAKRDACRPHPPMAMRCGSQSVRFVRNETAFFKRFFPKATELTQFQERTQVEAGRRATSGERKKFGCRRTRRIFAPHKPDCAKVRELRPAIRRLEVLYAASAPHDRNAIRARCCLDRKTH